MSLVYMLGLLWLWRFLVIALGTRVSLTVDHFGSVFGTAG